MHKGEKRLDAATIAFYQENGYVLFKQPVFADEKFQRLTALFEDLLERRDDAGQPLNLDTPHFYEPRLLEFLLADEILDLVEPLIGPDIGLWSSHFINKEPFTGKATPWHEDSAYWAGRFDRFDQIVTIWLALDVIDQENGCMRVIPGTHHNGFSAYEHVDAQANIFDSQIKPDVVDEREAVYFELAPNQCSLHDSRLVHGAKANNSPRRRCGYTMRYFSQRMKFQRDNPGNRDHKLWHCRSENIAHNPVEPLPAFLQK